MPTAYQTQDKLLLDYTFKTGETSAIKKIMEFINKQESVKQTIINKAKNKNDYAIGSDTTFDKERLNLIKKGGE